MSLERVPAIISSGFLRFTENVLTVHVINPIFFHFNPSSSDLNIPKYFVPIYTTLLLTGSIWIHNTFIFLSLLSRGPNNCQEMPPSIDLKTPSDVPAKILFVSVGFIAKE